MAVNTNNWGQGDVVIKYGNNDICHTVNPAIYQSPAADGSTIAGLTSPTDEKFGIAPFEHTLKLRNELDGNGSYIWFHPTPYVSISSEMITQAKRLGQGKKITLEGVLMCGWGQCGTDCWEERAAFINTWATNFLDLTIEEDDIEVMRFSNCKVESIDFEESQLASSTLGYSVTLSSFDNWSGVNGVTDPVEDFSFNEGEDGVISMTHNISAKGFPATVGGFHYSAFSNAKNYVTSLTGYDPGAAPVIPNFIGKANDGKIYPLLISQTEAADRMAGTYSISENWQFNQYTSDGDAPVGYQPIDTINISHDHAGADGEESRSTITLTRKGDLHKNLNATAQFRTPSASDLRNLLIANIDAYGAAEAAPQLNTYPEEFSVEENTFSNTMTYSATFSDFDPYGSEKVIFDPSYSFNEDTSKESFEITISGPLKAKATSQKQKTIDIEEWIATKEQYTSRAVGASTVHGGSPNSTIPLGIHGYLYDLAATFYSENAFCTATMPGYAHPHSHNLESRRNLHPRPTSFSVSRNPNSAEYTLSATFNSDPTYNVFRDNGGPHGTSSMVRWNYNIEFQHGIHQFKPHADVHNHGYYVIYDLMAHRAERATISIDINQNPSHSSIHRELGDYDQPGATTNTLVEIHDLRGLIMDTFKEEGDNGFDGYHILSESTNGDVRSENWSWNVQLIQDMNAGLPANYELIRDDEMYIPPR